MNEHPQNAINAKSHFHPYGYYNITLQIGVVMFKGPVFTYLNRSCIGFLTQVSGHTMLRKCEIKIAVLIVILTLVLQQTFVSFIILSSVYSSIMILPVLDFTIFFGLYCHDGILCH